MKILKIFGINFLLVFFANYVIPGIQVMDQTKLPHIRGDLIMALGLAFLNTLILPILKMLGQATAVKIAILAVVLNFATYAVIRWVPVSIGIMNIEGYLMVSLVVSIGSFLTNFFEMKRQKKGMLPP
ncbi:MAG: phage holin family protein [Verrucomicrobia bacterium]|nr:phage holin family protein [Verrucomicrobiota bacterium]MBU6447013.1 phage holin family protein [Verrucomicrobiota bacterium]MDE3047913.1 phage holin family protein [Verrucomicrobiota bacterium]